MQTNILWTGREYYSLENCLVNSTESGAIIDATIVGKYGEKLYLVTYQIRTNPDWETVFAVITARHSDQVIHVEFEGDAKGNWTMNGETAEQFSGCLDVDIAVTPFTNTLPIRRLQLKEQAPQQIRVIYFNILEQEIKPVDQEYTRLSETAYHYENITRDFEAKLMVDEQGLVVDYQGLFERTMAVPANYVR